jgi:D-glycero-alpha-D-manno-heptose-7-phosphate kinase
MIISKTPFRISFFGGGTDYPGWYNHHQGKVISVTIDKYSYVMVKYLPELFDYNYRIRYYETERVKNTSDISHPTVKNFLKFSHNKNRLDILYFSDLVAMSGIGSSSAFTVGLINSYYNFFKKKIDKYQIFKLAIHVEQNLNKESVGSQDQVSCAIGGFNSINFFKKDISILNLNKFSDNIKKIENSMLFFYVGKRKSTSLIGSRDLLGRLKKKENLLSLNRIYETANEAEKLIKSKNFSEKEFGELLHVSWIYKKESSSKITTDKIDEIYNIAKNNGAYGGKLLGSGGGGFMILLANPHLHKKIMNKLKQVSFVDINFIKSGSEIAYNLA